MSAGRSRVITEPLGGSPLSQALQNGRLPVSLQPWRPASLDEWRSHATSVRASMPKEWYRAIAPAIAAKGAAKERLERVASEGGVVITTGQQASLFGGPLYTLTKALTALEMADDVERQLGVPAAPLFWAATDDADFLEASVASAADARGLHELRLTEKPPAGTPMGLASLGGEVEGLLDELRAACGSAANAQFFEVARDAYVVRRSAGDAYVALMRALLEPLGVGVLDSSHDAYRVAARPILVSALHHALDVARADIDRAAEIGRAGFTPQVEDDRGLSLVAVIQAGVKSRVPVEEAAAYAPRMDVAFAPNVLLRPVVERAILPTIAYVAGPAELAYFVQSNAVADALGLQRVVGVPRWSCTVMEPFAERALSRLDASYHELREPAVLERKLAAAALPTAVADAWNTLKQRVGESIAQLGKATDETKLLPRAVIEGLERAMGFRMKRAERRLLAAVKRREQRVHEDITVASAALFPNGERQERVLNFIPMLARGGDDLVADMRAAARTHAASLVRAARSEPVGAR